MSFDWTEFQEPIYDMISGRATKPLHWADYRSPIPDNNFTALSRTITNIHPVERHHDDMGVTPIPLSDLEEVRHYRLEVTLGIDCYGDDAYGECFRLRDAFNSTLAFNLPTRIGLLRSGSIRDLSSIRNGFMTTRARADVYFLWGVSMIDQTNSIESATIRGTLLDTNNPPDYQREVITEVEKP